MQEPSQRPIIFGEVLFDHFPDGSAVLGGAPFNVAWNLHGLGLQPLMVSRVGEDAEGERILAAMRDWGMDTAGMQIDPEHPTGAVSITLSGGEPSFSILPDQAYDFIDATALPELASGGLLYHGSLALRNVISRQALDELAACCGLPRFVDINLRAPWWEREAARKLVAGARWAKLNEHELHQLGELGIPDALELAARLQRECELELLIVTLGSDGAMVRRADGEIHRVAPRPSAQVVDTVGAGDAFASVVLVGLLRGWPVEQMLERAQGFASRVVGLRGATTMDRSFYETQAAEWGHP
jgi:fructokinase